MPRVCTICTHPKRVAIDRALLEGEPFRNIAERFGTSTTSLTRHKADHLSERMVKAVTRSAEADVRTAIDVAGQLKAINSATLSVLKDARSAGDGLLSLQAIDRVQKQIELQAKLIDLINDGDTVNIIIAPQWIELRTVLLTALQGHPAALQAVAGALASIEGGNHHARVA
jgi:hypothetical protein